MKSVVQADKRTIIQVLKSPLQSSKACISSCKACHAIALMPELCGLCAAVRPAHPDTGHAVAGPQPDVLKSRQHCCAGRRRRLLNRVRLQASHIDTGYRIQQPVTFCHLTCPEGCSALVSRSVLGRSYVQVIITAERAIMPQNALGRPEHTEFVEKVIATTQEAFAARRKLEEEGEEAASLESGLFPLFTVSFQSVDARVNFPRKKVYASNSRASSSLTLNLGYGCCVAVPSRSHGKVSQLFNVLAHIGSLANSFNPDLPYQPFELVVLEAALKEVPLLQDVKCDTC